LENTRKRIIWRSKSTDAPKPLADTSVEQLSFAANTGFESKDSEKESAIKKRADLRRLKTNPHPMFSPLSGNLLKRQRAANANHQKE
jgi:hypothetical protein